MFRPDRTTLAIAGGGLLLTAALVALTLRREPPQGFPPTPASPREVGTELVRGRVTLDATDPGAWVYFDFSRASRVQDPDPAGWDLAFQRFQVRVNGGPGFAGQGAAVDLGDVTFDSVATAPQSGWLTAPGGRDSANPALDRWYDYSFTSHLLTPRPATYAIRTADGRYAKLRFLSYYCPDATPGCITFDYAYQGDGSRGFETAH